MSLHVLYYFRKRGGSCLLCLNARYAHENVSLWLADAGDPQSGQELAAGIKMESSDQGIKMNSERLISTDQCTFSDTWQAWVRFVL